MNGAEIELDALNDYLKCNPQGLVLSRKWNFMLLKMSVENPRPTHGKMVWTLSLPPHLPYQHPSPSVIPALHLILTYPHLLLTDDGCTGLLLILSFSSLNTVHYGLPCHSVMQTPLRRSPITLPALLCLSQAKSNISRKTLCTLQFSENRQ